MKPRDKKALQRLRDNAVGDDKRVLRKAVSHIERLEGKLAKTLYLMNGSQIMAEGQFYGQPDNVMHVDTNHGLFEVTCVEHYTGFVYTTNSFKRID